jgi:hypothetical protein
MTQHRKQLVVVEDTPYYLIFFRCVRLTCVVLMALAISLESQSVGV